MFKITVRDIATPFHGGYHKEEEKITQTLHISVSLGLPSGPFMESGALEDTADYTTVVPIVQSVVSQGEELLESIAVQIADQLEARHPEIETLEICIRKHPHLSSQHNGVEVVYQR